MNRSSHLTRRLSALVLASVLGLGCAVPTFAAEPAPIGNGVTPVYDEAYYATLDYYGNLTEGSVVKSYALNGATELTDYGVYDEVVNLTDGTAPVSEKKAETRFQFKKDAPSHFYFEGKTKKPYEALPWTISMHYTLNGVPTPAEDLAGKTGVVEICIDLVPNESASQYARYNYTLEAMALFNQDDILSLEAPGAQVQLVGNLRMVLFLALPGEEQHFTIRVGAEDFAFEGMTFLMVPATLSQLEQFAELSQRREELEDDYHKLSGGFDDLLSAMGDLTGNLNSAANGLDQLNDARGTFSDGKDVLYEGTDALRGDLTNLADLIEPVTAQIETLSGTITTSKEQLNTIMDTMVSLKGQLKDMQNALENLTDGSGDLKSLVRSISRMRSSLSTLQSALNNLSGGGGGDVTPPEEIPSSRELVKQVKAVHAAYEEADQTAFFVKMLLISGKASSQSEAKTMAAGMEKLLALPDDQAAQLPADQQAILKQAKELQGLFTAKSKLSFQKFCEQLPGITPEQAKQMNDVWIVLSAGKVPEGSSLSDELVASLLHNDPGPDAPAPEEKPSENDTIGGAVVDLITEGLDSTSKKLAAMEAKLNATLKEIAGPTASVVGDLENVCHHVKDVEDLLDDAENLTAALASSAKKIQDVIDEADALRTTLNEYEPTLQESLSTLGQLSTSLGTTARDTESLIASAEDLLKRSGTKLDAGTKKTLEELASLLRRTSKVTASTSAIKKSKDGLTSIIEDTWNEHTGEIDNLLNMDATAKAQSLTDSRNPSPQSIQVLIRSQEIKVEEPEENSAAAKKADKGTFWSRVVQMFKDFWAAITGLFH